MPFGYRSVFVRFTSAKLQKNSKTCKNFAKILLNLRISNVFCTFAADFKYLLYAKIIHYRGNYCRHGRNSRVQRDEDDHNKKRVLSTR